jgi:aminoglycoside phosphotransferase (APT) family kinase protein
MALDAHAANASLASAREELLSRALKGTAGAAAQILSMQLAAGGNSRETWLADVLFAEGPPGNARSELVPRRVEMRREISGLRLAQRAGVPVPRVLASSEEIEVGRPFVVTEFVEGTAIAKRVLRDAEYAPARAVFARQCGEILARLHTAELPVPQTWAPYDPLQDLEKYLPDSAYSSPVLLGAMRWLERNRPPAPACASAIHRDFRLGNLMVSEAGIAAVLDWETCQLGDPDEDIAWLCSRSWRYGSDQPVGGVGSMTDLLEAYQRCSGRAVDPRRLHWWSVYAETRWGLASTVRQRPASPGDRMEQAAVCRRGCRQEYFVLLELQRYVGK